MLRLQSLRAGVGLHRFYQQLQRRNSSNSSTVAIRIIGNSVARFNNYLAARVFTTSLNRHFPGVMFTFPQYDPQRKKGLVNSVKGGQASDSLTLGGHSMDRALYCAQEELTRGADIFLFVYAGSAEGTSGLREIISGLIRGRGAHHWSSSSVSAATTSARPLARTSLSVPSARVGSACPLFHRPLRARHVRAAPHGTGFSSQYLGSPPAKQVREIIAWKLLSEPASRLVGTRGSAGFPGRGEDRY